MRTLIVAVLLLLLTVPGCYFQRWGTQQGGPELPQEVPATDLIVLVEDDVMRRICEDVGVFGRVGIEADPWPHVGGPTPHPPDAWIEVRVEEEPPDSAVHAAQFYFAISIVPALVSLGHALPVLHLANRRLVLVARCPRPDDVWIRGNELDRVEVRYREGRVLWGLLAGMVCHKWMEPAPPEILEGGLRLLAKKLADPRQR